MMKTLWDGFDSLGLKCLIECDCKILVNIKGAICSRHYRGGVLFCVHTYIFTLEIHCQSLSIEIERLFKMWIS